VAARKPAVAHAEIGNLGLVLGIDGRDAAAPFDHIGPFGGVGLPVKLPKRSGEGLGFDAAERIAEGGKLGRVERGRRQSVTRLRRLGPQSFGAPQQAIHRRSSVLPRVVGSSGA
jgi:hypothetical protein